MDGMDGVRVSSGRVPPDETLGSCMCKLNQGREVQGRAGYARHSRPDRASNSISLLYSAL